MPLAKNDTVQVHYKGTLDDGTLFDSSEGREPLSFVIGGGMLLPKFEEAVIGKNTGDVVSVSISAKDAYGERDEDLVLTLERSLFEVEEIEEGMMLEIETEDGPISVYVIECTDEHVTIDGNHPLTSETLHFTITIL